MNKVVRKAQRPLGAIVTVILATAGWLGVTGTPAFAAWSSCPVEAVCLYPATGGIGAPDLLYPPTVGCSQLAQGLRNDAESVWNRAGEPVWLRDGDNCSGTSYAVADTWKIVDLGSFKNKTNSVQTQ